MRTLASLIGPRRRVLMAILLVGLWAGWKLDLSLGDAIPSAAGWNHAREFFAAALSPAINYESQALPPDTPPLLGKVVDAIWKTVAFATAGVSLALAGGLMLGFLASSAWWEDDPAGGTSAFWRALRRLVAPAVMWFTRTLIALLRSIHELLWAVLFLSAMGLNTLTAILAIAIPYTGVFAKVFSEMIDEAPREPAYAIRSLGGSPVKVFCFGLLPRALPDMTAYACYRLECGLRSSAVLGFFGITTLGYYLKPAFDEQHYREVWTYLYALILLIVAVDWWSNQMRRRLVQ